MPLIKPNPFVYGPPVKGTQFLGREEELRTIFGRFGHPYHPQSTAVTGEPHIGKTSLLHKLADRSTQEQYLAQYTDGLITHYQELLYLSNDFTPTQFWQDALLPLRQKPGGSDVTRRLNKAEQADYTSESLRQLFSYLATKNRRLVLLLDEFERLLIHPHFQDPAFFAGVRSLANNTGGLALVIASRASIAKMNRRGRDLLQTGSPFFNNMVEIRLRPFSEMVIDQLLAIAGNLFSPEAQTLIRQLGGGNPFLLQAAAGIVFEINGKIVGMLDQAKEQFYTQVGFHFEDVWDVLVDDAIPSRQTHTDLQQLRQQIKEFFSLNELQDLCFDLRIPYDDLPGQSRSDKVRELIMHCERNGRLVELIQAVRHKRPSTF